jgi:hypothetical protein
MVCRITALLGILCLLCSEVSFAQQSFTESAATYNLDISGSKDGGFSFGDLNNDGYLDVVINTRSSSAGTRVLFNDGPPSWTFTDVTATHCDACDDQALERSAVIADFNNDGYLDFMRNKSTRLELFLNKGPSPADGDPDYSFGDADQEANFQL